MILKYMILARSTTVVCFQQLSILINVGISSRSHVSGILEISKELTERGHKVHYATASRYHFYAKGYNVTLHQLPDIPGELYTGIDEACRSFIKSTRGLSIISDHRMDAYQFFYQEYQKTFPAISNLVKSTHFDLVICDFYSMGCRDATNALGIPMIIGLQSTVSFGLFNLPYMSNNLEGKSTTIENMSILEKVNDFTLTRYKSWKMSKIQRDAFNDARKKFGVLPNHKFLGPLNKNLILSTSFTGFETAFHAPPNLRMIGPVRSRVIKPLSDEINQFINLHKRTICVGFGTYATMIQEDIDDVTNALKILIDDGKIDGAIWGMGTNSFSHAIHSKILFISSAPQKAILHHYSTKLFISHCGIESVFESIEAAVPILCFPLIGDQPINSAKVEEAGIGRQYNRRQSTPTALAQLASVILEDERNLIRDNLTRLKAITERRSLHAVSDGANIVEDHAYTAKACRPFQSLDASVSCEVAHLIPVSERIPFFKAHLLDVYSLLALISLMIISFVLGLLKLIYNQLRDAINMNHNALKKTN